MHIAFRQTLITLSLLTAAHMAFADEYSDVSRLMKAGQNAEAMGKIDQYLGSKPKDPQMRFFKGVALAEMGKSTEAISVFTKLTDDYPELPEPYNNLAVLYAGQSQFDKARAALEMAIRTNPTYATAHENLGDVYARLASQAYSKALQLDGTNTAVPPKLALIRDLFAANTKPGKTAAAPAKSKPAAAPAPAAPAPVAAAPAATPVPAPVAAPEKAAVAAGSKEVEAAVLAWATAWSARDMKSYLGAYGSGFDNGGKKSRAEWEQDRTSRIMGKSHISVKLSNLVITQSEGKATAKFRQEYKADKLAVSSQKTLELVQSGGRWLIVRESSK